MILIDTVRYYLKLSDIIVSDSVTITSDSDIVTISDTVALKNTYLALSDTVLLQTGHFHSHIGGLQQWL